MSLEQDYRPIIVRPKRRDFKGNGVRNPMKDHFRRLNDESLVDYYSSLILQLKSGKNLSPQRKEILTLKITDVRRLMVSRGIPIK